MISSHGQRDLGASYGRSDIALVIPRHAVQMGQQRMHKPILAAARFRHGDPVMSIAKYTVPWSLVEMAPTRALAP